MIEISRMTPSHYPLFRLLSTYTLMCHNALVNYLLPDPFRLLYHLLQSQFAILLGKSRRSPVFNFHNDLRTSQVSQPLFNWCF